MVKIVVIFFLSAITMMPLSIGLSAQGASTQAPKTLDQALVIPDGTERLIIEAKKDDFKEELHAFREFRHTYYTFWTWMVGVLAVTLVLF